MVFRHEFYRGARVRALCIRSRSLCTMRISRRGKIPFFSDAWIVSYDTRLSLASQVYRAKQAGASLTTVIDAAQTKTGMTGSEEPLGKFSFDGQSLPVQVKSSTRAIVRTAPNTTRYDIADTLFYEAYRMHLKMWW